MPSDAKCVHCRARPIDPAWRPFCSERCKMADLGRWLSGGYRVAGGSELIEDEEEPDPPARS